MLQKEAKIATLSQDIANNVEKSKHLGENKALFDQVSSKRELLNSHFLGSRDEDMVAFLGQVESFASSTNVELAIETPTFLPLSAKTKVVVPKSNDPVVLNKEVANLPSDVSKWEMLQLHLRTAGSWANVLQFISLVESMPYQVSFTQANLAVGLGADLKKKTKVWSGVFTITVLKNK
jgi:hypothetical protein